MEHHSNSGENNSYFEGSLIISGSGSQIDINIPQGLSVEQEEYFKKSFELSNKIKNNIMEFGIDKGGSSLNVQGQDLITRKANIMYKLIDLENILKLSNSQHLLSEQDSADCWSSLSMAHASNYDTIYSIFSIKNSHPGSYTDISL